MSAKAGRSFKSVSFHRLRSSSLPSKKKAKKRFLLNIYDKYLKFKMKRAKTSGY